MCISIYIYIIYTYIYTPHTPQHAAAPSQHPGAWDVACIARVLPTSGQSVDCSARTPHPSQHHPAPSSTLLAAPSTQVPIYSGASTSVSQMYI